MGRTGGIEEVFGEGYVTVIEFFFVVVGDEGDVLKYFEGSTEVGFGFVFNDGDDEDKGIAVIQADTFDGIGVPRRSG
jgi:hypothetical protein